MQPFQSPAFQPMTPMQGADVTDRLNLTDRNLGTLMQEVAGHGGLNIQFFYVRTRVETANVARHGQFRTRLCVAKMPKGDRLTIATRFITEEQAMREFPREFSMFKQYQDVPTLGTPLHELPGITQSQIAILVLHNLRSIEDVANCPDEIVSQAGYDAREAKKLAVRWVANKVGNADTIEAARKDAERDAELARLRKESEETARRNIELEAQLRALREFTGAGGTAGAIAGGPAGAVTAPNGVQMIDRVDDLPDAREVESRLFEGGMVTDNEGMDDDPPPVTATKEDPLGIKGGK